MKRHLKPAIVIPVVIALAILSAIVYLLVSPPDKTSAPSRLNKPSKSRSDKSTPKVDPTKNPSQPAPASPPTPAASPGAYVDYREGIIASTKNEKLLFFHAAWCPQCRALEADIKNQGVPENTTIIKIDYDNSQSFRQKYGVTIQTTIIRVDDNGNLVKRFVAYKDPTLDAVIQGTR